MKKPLEIPVLLVHRGAARTVAALGLHDELPAAVHLLELQRHNPKGFQIVRGQIQFLSNAPEIRNREMFKLLDASRRLFEFRSRAGLRLYCFVDGDSLILLTNGGKKNTTKEQNRDIQRAKELQDAYLELKRQGATLKWIETHNPNPQ